VFRLADTGTDTIRDLSAADTLILQAGLAIDPAKTLQANVDASGSLDTVLTLSNGAKIVLLDVTAAEWAAYAPNVSIQTLTGDDLTL
jgi:Ca2+-binding RTX toxin-like protein